MKKTVAFIPARGGSKGVPGKNIKPFMGKPLLIHSIEFALNSENVSGVYVSTDDSEIAAIARQSGAEIIDRPAEIAGDKATTESAVKHGIEWMDKNGENPDIMVLLQATSPLRPADSLNQALEKFEKYHLDSLLTISPTHRFFWHVDGENAVAEYDYLNRPRRQDMTEKDIRYVENGSFYIFTVEHFKKIGNRLGGKIGYQVLPEEYAAEIDTLLDFEYLEKIATQLL